MLRFVTLSGFLGAGKTTTMTRAAERFRVLGRNTAVITNDQGEQLVDSVTAQAAAVPVREVTGGCFCCRFEDLADVTVELTRQHQLDVVIAEAVGSCTDVTATVIRPLQEYYGAQFDVAPLTTVIDPTRYLELTRANLGAARQELAWLLHKQLEDAEIIAVNKVDMYPPHRIDEIVETLQRRYADARVHRYSATTGEGLDGLLELWTQGGRPRRTSTLDIDYARYGAAEALLGWLDRRITLRTESSAGFDVGSWAQRFLMDVDAGCAARGATVGHVKVHVTNEQGSTSGNLVGAGTARLSQRHGASVTRAEALINARVACPPAELTEIVDKAVQSACSAVGASADTADGEVFVPGQPDPTHRITSVG